MAFKLEESFFPDLIKIWISFMGSAWRVLKFSKYHRKTHPLCKSFIQKVKNGSMDAIELRKIEDRATKTIDIGVQCDMGRSVAVGEKSLMIFIGDWVLT